MAIIRANRKPPDGRSFTVKEVSAGVYELKADAPDGLHMMRTAWGPYEEVLSKLIDEAWKLSE
jgi:hypothetical protein